MANREIVELQEKNTLLGNLLVHHKTNVNWPGIETWLSEFHLLPLCFYTCLLCIYILMCMSYLRFNVELVTAN
jgi:uncharacterized membrane protein